MYHSSTVRNISIKVLLLTFLLICSVLQLFAQTTVSDTLQVDLDEITVEATQASLTIGKAPMSVSYLTRSTADRVSRPATTLDELTFTLPGIFVSNRENFALGERLTIRGMGWRAQFGVRGSQVMLDGIPLTVADGQTILSMIDPAMIKNIELLRGPSATFWGNSSGGVLYLSTKPSPDAPGLTYRGFGGSYSSVKQELQWNQTVGKSRSYGYATYYNTDGFRDHSAAQLFRASAAVETPVGNQGRLTTMVTYANMPTAEHPGSLTDDLAESEPQRGRELFKDTSTGKEFQQGMISANYFHDFSGGLLNVSSHGTYRNVDNPVLFRYIGLERLAGGLRATYQFKDLPFDLHTGGEIKIQNDDRFVTNNISGQRGEEIEVQQTELVTNQALFTQIGLPLGSRLRANAGVRTDWIQFEAKEALSQNVEGSRSFFSVNPSIGLSYNFSRNTLYSNFSTSFESPTTTELVNRPDGTGGFNPQLDPEKAVSLEAGLRGAGGKNNFLRYDITLYRMNINNLLIPFELEEFEGVTFFRNEGKTNHYGLETSLQFRFSNSISAAFMLNLMNAEFSGGPFDGNDVPGVSPARYALQLNVEPGSHLLSLDHEWVGKYKTDSANSTSSNAYSLFNFRWAYNGITFGSGSALKPFLAINNVLNTRYNTSVAVNAFGNRFFEPGSDRNFRAGIQVEFN